MSAAANTTTTPARGSGSACAMAIVASEHESHLHVGHAEEPASIELRPSEQRRDGGGPARDGFGRDRPGT